MIQSKQHNGIVFVVLGTLLFSSKAILVKLLFEQGIGALELQALRMLMILPFYLAILLWLLKTQKTFLSLKDVIATVIGGIACYHIASYLDLLGLMYISAGLERMILFCYPAVSLFFAWLLLKEPVTKRMWFALVLAYLGVGVFFVGDIEFGSEHLVLGSVLVFLASIFTAWYMITNQVYSRKIGSQRFTCIAMIGAVVSMLTHAALQGVDDLTSFKDEVYIGAASIAIFCTLIPTFLVSAGVKIIGASKAGIVGAIGPVITIILSNFLLDEPVTWLHALGLILVVLGMRLLK